MLVLILVLMLVLMLMLLLVLMLMLVLVLMLVPEERSRNGRRAFQKRSRNAPGTPVATGKWKPTIGGHVASRW